MRRTEVLVVAALAVLALVAALLAPDLPQLRHLLPPRLGPRAHARHEARLPGLRRTDRAPAVPRHLRAGWARRHRRRAPDRPHLRAGLVALAWGSFRVGEACFGLWPGLAAAAFVASSFAFLLYAARAYVDVPFLALVLWAAALEARAPRRGVPVMAVLAVAGLLRPEAWVLAGAYWLWCGWRRIDLLALAAAAPGGVGAGRPVGHRRPALLAARDQRPRRRAQSQSRRCHRSRARSSPSSPTRPRPPVRARRRSAGRARCCGGCARAARCTSRSRCSAPAS